MGPHVAFLDYQIQVAVKSVSEKRKVTLEWLDDVNGCLGEFQITDLTLLFETKQEALDSIIRGGKQIENQ